VTRRVLYLHGFASSPRGRKVEALSPLFAPERIEIEAPDLNIPSFERLDFEAMVAAAMSAAAGARIDVLAGSSLGALVALEASRRGVSAPLVLIAPALGFGRRWVEKLPAGDPVFFFHHGENAKRPIHRAFFEQMSRRPTDREPPPASVAVLMGRHDESVPYETVEEVWRQWEATGRLRPGSRWIEIPEGDHGLTGFVGEIADQIRIAAG
jgi:predicted esterase YcpF (UPF0227 family)